MPTKPIKRFATIRLNPTAKDTFQATGQNGQELLPPEADFFIYFRNAVFFEDGSIEGVYLGENPKTIVDEYTFLAHHVEGRGWVTGKGEPLKQANMVAVENKMAVVVVISGGES